MQRCTRSRLCCARAILVSRLRCYEPKDVVTSWNDRLAANAEEVIATLRAAAAIEKARHGAAATTATTPEPELI
jgi:hypothetical protein